MPVVYAANESSILVNGTAVEGVRSVEHRSVAVRTDLYAVGSSERIGVVTGPRNVEGRIRVASSAPDLDALTGDEFFQVTAPLRQGATTVTLSFDECLMVEKSFTMSAGGHGETVYAFTATRVREER